MWAGWRSETAHRGTRPRSKEAARDEAILRLAFGLGLRRNEIASLDIGHVNRKLLVLGKGSRERIALTLPRNAKDALTAWLEWRAGCPADAPLFVNLARNSPGNRLSGAGVYHVIAYQLGERANIAARPHGLRHAAITAALDAFGGDYRKARAFRAMHRLRRFGGTTIIAPTMPGKLPLSWMASPRSSQHRRGATRCRLSRHKPSRPPSKSHSSCAYQLVDAGKRVPRPRPAARGAIRAERGRGSRWAMFGGPVASR